MPNMPKGYAILEFDEIDSTNSEAKRLIGSGKALDCQVIFARRQSQGRGRYGRSWQSPEGNLYFSVIFKLEGDLRQASQMSFVTAVALGTVLSRVLAGNVCLQYKWPNDVLANEKKIAGILLESILKDSSDKWLIAGVGLNVDKAPDGVKIDSTSIKDLSGSKICVREILEEFICVFDNELNIWQKQGFGCIRDKWLDKAYQVNEEIKVNLGRETFFGTFKGLSQNGELEVVVDNKKRLVSAGEVFSI